MPSAAEWRSPAGRQARRTWSRHLLACRRIAKLSAELGRRRTTPARRPGSCRRWPQSAFCGDCAPRRSCVIEVAVIIVVAVRWPAGDNVDARLSRQPRRATARATSVTGGASAAGSVGATPLFVGAASAAVVPASWLSDAPRKSVVARTCDRLPPFNSSARAKSRHRRNLSTGSWESARAKIASNSVRSGRTSLGRGGRSLRCLPITTAGLKCANGGEPVNR